MKVAYVDDLEGIRITVQLNFEAISIECETYRARNEFLRAVIKSPPDVYILDGNFPIFHSDNPTCDEEYPTFLAHETTREIRRRNPEAKIVIYSDDKKCLEIPGVTVVKKEEGPMKLVEIVQNLT